MSGETGGDATELDVRHVKLERGADHRPVNIENQGLPAPLHFPTKLLVEFTQLSRTK